MIAPLDSANDVDPSSVSIAQAQILGTLLEEADRVQPMLRQAGISSAHFTTAENRRLYSLIQQAIEDHGPGVNYASMAMSGCLGDLADHADRVYAAHCAPNLLAPRIELLRLYHARPIIQAQIAEAARVLDTASPDEYGTALSRLRDTIDDVEGQMSRRLMPALDAGDLIARDPPPLDPVMDGLFETGDKVEAIGGAKQRKTFFATEVALHIATGRRWMRFDVPKRRRTLFAQLEVKGSHFHRRLHAQARALGITPGEVRDWLFVMNGRGHAGPDVLDRVEVMAIRLDVEVIFLDPRYKLMAPGTNENAGDQLSELLARFDRLVERTGAALFITHHDPKGAGGDRALIDRGAGSNFAARDADCRLVLSPQRDKPDAVVVQGITRNFAPPPDFVVRWQDGRFIEEESLDPAPQTTADRLRHRPPRPAIENYIEPAVQILAEEGPMNAARFQARLHRLSGSRDRGRDLASILVDEGRIVRIELRGRGLNRAQFRLPGQITELESEDDRQ